MTKAYSKQGAILLEKFYLIAYLFFGSLGIRVVRPISWASEPEEAVAFQIEA